MLSFLSGGGGLKISHIYSNLSKLLFKPTYLFPYHSHYFGGILAVQSLSHICILGISYQPGHCGEVQFRSDTWYQNYPLNITFSQLFDICSTTNVSVQEVVATQGHCLRFRRILSGVLLQEWHQILHIISSTSFTRPKPIGLAVGHQRQIHC